MCYKVLWYRMVLYNYLSDIFSFGVRMSSLDTRLHRWTLLTNICRIMTGSNFRLRSFTPSITEVWRKRRQSLKESESKGLESTMYREKRHKSVVRHGQRWSREQCVILWLNEKEERWYNIGPWILSPTMFLCNVSSKSSLQTITYLLSFIGKSIQ